jgi:hypothetical protein
MSVSSLRVTYFQADKMMGVSGLRAGQLRQSAPYRITTYRGPELGLMGELSAVLHKLHELDSTQAANGSDTEDRTQPLLQRLQRCLVRR